MFRRWLAICFALFLIVTGITLILPRPAEAHGYIVRSIPQDRATIARAPTRVQVWFSEGLEARFSTISVTDQSGKRVDLGDGGVVPNNPDQIQARLPPNLPDGAYIAAMRMAFTSDGHVDQTTIVFWVGQKSGADATSGTTAEVQPLEVIARALTLIGMMLSFGVLFAYRFALYPAWRNVRYVAGGLAPRIMDALYRLIAAALAAAIIGNLLWIVEQSMLLFDANLARVFRDGLWSIILNGTQFGDYLKVRLIALIGVAVAVGASYQFRKTRPPLVYPLHSVSMVALAGTLGTLSLTAHAAGSTLWPLPSIAADWLHLLANSAWLGGLIGVIAALRPALDPLATEGRRLALLAVLRRWSVIAPIALALVIVTGIYSALLYIYTPDQLVSTDYGRTLTAKLLLIAPLFGLGLIHFLALSPGRFATAARWLPTSMAREGALGICVILVAALLTATAQPVPANDRASARLPTYLASEGAFTLSLTPNPNAMGSNAYDVTLLRDDQPLDGARVVAQFVYPALGTRSTPIALDGESNGLYIGAGAELSKAGAWQAVFDVWPLDDSTDPIRIALTWPVTAQASGVDRVPSILNILSAAAILIALAVWIIPRIRRRLRGVHVDGQMALIGVSAVALTVLVMVGGAYYLASAARTYADAANPPPQYVNPSLPNQGSIRAGAALYAADCASCHEVPTSSLNAYLALHNDSTVFSFLKPNASHPYADPLSDADRWAVINFLRAHFRTPIP